MKKIFSLFVFLLMLVGMTVLPQQVQAFDEKPVGFVVIDKTGGNVTGEVYSSWRQVVKWA